MKFVLASEDAAQYEFTERGVAISEVLLYSSKQTEFFFAKKLRRAGGGGVAHPSLFRANLDF